MAGPIRIAVLANAAQARQELNSLEGSATKTGKGFAVASRVAAAGMLAIGAGAKVAVDAASDLAEEVSKSQQIFGNQAKGIEDFASRAASALGQSKQAALDATSTFGQIGQKAGLGGAAAADFAKQFTVLASDLASFNNTTPEAAIEAIGSAMRGEAEPIRKYGVLLDDATLRATALKLGLIDTVKQGLTPQQKALAASRAILDQTGKAQGDFARTSDGAANSARINAAKLQDLKAKLGAGLLPAYQQLLKIVGKVADFMSKNTGTVKVLVVAFVAFAAVMLIANAALKTYTIVTGVYNAVTAIQAANAKRAAAGQVALNLAMLANPVLLIVAGVILLVGAIVLAYKKSDKFREIVNGAFEKAKNAAMAAFNWIKKNWPLLLAILTGPVGIAVLVISKNWEKIKAGASAVKNFVRDRFLDLLERLRNIGTRIKNALLTPFNAIKGVIQSILDLIGKIKIPKLPDIKGGGIPFVPGLRVFSGRTADPSALGSTVVTNVIPVQNRNYTINLTVPVGGSLIEAGRTIVAAITEYEDFAGKRLTA